MHVLSWKSSWGCGGVETVEALRSEGAPLSAALLTSFRFIDFQDNTCIDTQQSCVYDEHVSPSAASPVLPLTWHCYMWLHVMCDV